MNEAERQKLLEALKHFRLIDDTFVKTPMTCFIRYWPSVSGF